MEYAGITSEKKTQPAIIYKTLLYLIEYQKGFIERMNAKINP